MVENNYLSSSNKIHHHIFHLLLYVAKVFKQSHTVRSGRFESNFLTLQGKPNSHVTCNFRRHIFPFFPGCGTGSPSSTTKYDDSAPACARMRNDVQRKWKESPLAGPIKYSAYRLPYSRHVASTFKRLTTTTTHRGLIDFWLNRRGITSTTTPPVNLILQCVVSI